MRFETCDIEGLVICKPQIINDKRGFFIEIFRKDCLMIYIKKIIFCQINCFESSLWNYKRPSFSQFLPSSQSKLTQ